MEEPSEDSPLDLEEYDYADHPIQEKKFIEIQKTGEMSNLSEGDHKTIPEFHKKLEATLPGTISDYQDQPIKRSEEATEVKETEGEQPPIEIPKMPELCSNAPEDYRKAVTEFKAAFDALNSFYGLTLNGEVSPTKGSDTSIKTDSSQGNRRKLKELIKKGLLEIQRITRPDTIKRTNITKSHKKLIVHSHAPQVIEGDSLGDSCKAFGDQIATLATDATRDYINSTNDTANEPKTSTDVEKTTGEQIRPTIQAADIQVITVITLSKDPNFDGQGLDTTEVPHHYVNDRVEQIDICDKLNKIKLRNGSIILKGRPKRKNFRPWGRRCNILSTGLMFSVLATNVFAFAIGFGYGWWCRHALPTLSVYELQLDPTLF